MSVKPGTNICEAFHQNSKKQSLVLPSRKRSSRMKEEFETIFGDIQNLT